MVFNYRYVNDFINCNYTLDYLHTEIWCILRIHLQIAIENCERGISRKTEFVLEYIRFLLFLLAVAVLLALQNIEIQYNTIKLYFNLPVLTKDFTIFTSYSLCQSDSFCLCHVISFTFSFCHVKFGRRSDLISVR
jgi:hypothetical protein